MDAAEKKKKTKAELLMELKRANDTITDLKKQLEKAEQIEKAYNCANEAGEQLAAAVKGFVDAGVPEGYAWQLIFEAMKLQNNQHKDVTPWSVSLY